MAVLDGKAAIVTGGGQGVGRGIALALARAGAAVCLVGRTRATLAKVAADIEGFGGRATLAVGDMVAFGIAHPCTTFERWQMLMLVDAQLNIVGAIRTFF